MEQAGCCIGYAATKHVAPGYSFGSVSVEAMRTGSRTESGVKKCQLAVVGVGSGGGVVWLQVCGHGVIGIWCSTSLEFDKGAQVLHTSTRNRMGHTWEQYLGSEPHMGYYIRDTWDPMHCL